jgi:hypothetical protein
MSTMSHVPYVDPRTGQPLKKFALLTDHELERELVIAALSARRSHRYDALLAERRRRRCGA